MKTDEKNCCFAFPFLLNLINLPQNIVLLQLLQKGAKPKENLSSHNTHFLFSSCKTSKGFSRTDWDLEHQFRWTRQ